MENSRQNPGSNAESNELDQFIESVKGSNKKDIKRKADDHKMPLDQKFQAGVINLCLKDGVIGTKLYTHFRSLQINTGDRKSEDDILFFTVPIYEKIWNCIYKYRAKNDAVPDEAILRQMIRETYSETEANTAISALEKILAIQIDDIEPYKERLQAYIERMIIVNFSAMVEILYGQKKYELIPQLWQRASTECQSVSLGTRPYVGLDSIFGYLEKKDIQTFSTGFPSFDAEMAGGFGRGELAVVVGGTNMGKTMYCADRAHAWSTAKNKVYYYAIDSKESEVPRRIVACKTGIYTKRLTPQERNSLNEYEFSALMEATKSISTDHLRINEKLSYPTTVEDLCLDIERVYHDWKADVFIVDYLTKLTSNKPFRDIRALYGHAANMLAGLAKKLNVAMLSPVQPNRESLKRFNGTGQSRSNPNHDYLRLTDISECSEIANVAANIITISASDEEVNNNVRRCLLEKTREGARFIKIGVKTDLGCSRFVTGDFFDPQSVAVDLDVDGGGQSPSDVKSVDGLNPLNAEAEKDNLRKSLMKIDAQILDLNGKIISSNKLISSYSGVADKADLLQVEAQKVSSFGIEKEALMVKARELSTLLYKHPTSEVISLAEKTLEDLKKESGNKEGRSRYKEQQTVVRLMKYSQNRDIVIRKKEAETIAALAERPNNPPIQIDGAKTDDQAEDIIEI